MLAEPVLELRFAHARQPACRRTANATCRGYAGLTRSAPHVIQLKGPYDIAVDPSPEQDGSYGLTTDWWYGHVAKEVGISYGRLLQSYGVHKTMREARARGLRSTRRVEADGSILLTLEGGSLCAAASTSGFPQLGKSPSRPMGSKGKAAKPRPRPSRKPSANPRSAPANPTTGGRPTAKPTNNPSPKEAHKTP